MNVAVEDAFAGVSRAGVAALMLARGLVEAYDRAVQDGGVIQQDATMPASLRRASALVARLCLEEGRVDIAASIHTLTDLGGRAMGEWGLAAFRSPFRFAGAVLVDRDAGLPTEDCREMAVLAGASEAAAQETVHHEALRTAVSRRPSNDRDRAYSAIRGFVVRNPAVRAEDLVRFIAAGGHAAALQVVQSFYRPIPQTALFARTARRCGHCGSLLWPDPDVAAFPEGRCRIRQCRLANPTPRRGPDIPDPGAWRVATPAISAYWVGPSLDEIRIHDALAAAGRRVELYPLQDAADVGIDRFTIGIDVKTSGSPVLLGGKLSRDIGRLGIFKRRILVVPDDKLVSNRDYLEQLRAAYRGATMLEFMTVSQVIADLSGKRSP